MLSISVVTVALGSMLATVMLNRDVTILQGAAAFTLLATLQWLVATLTMQLYWAMKAVRSSPRLLLHRGRTLEEGLEAERMAPSDLRTAARNQRHGKLDELFAIVSKMCGSLSVLKDERSDNGMEDVVGYRTDALKPGSARVQLFVQELRNIHQINIFCQPSLAHRAQKDERQSAA